MRLLIIIINKLKIGKKLFKIREWKLNNKKDYQKRKVMSLNINGRNQLHFKLIKTKTIITYKVISILIIFKHYKVKKH
jgi:hypothetical protein